MNLESDEKHEQSAPREGQTNLARIAPIFSPEVMEDLRKKGEEYMKQNVLPKCDIDHPVPGQGCAPPPDFKDARPQAG